MRSSPHLIAAIALLALVLHDAAGEATTEARVADLADIPERHKRHEHALCFLKGMLFLIGGRGVKDILAFNHSAGPLGAWTNYGPPPSHVGNNGEIHHFQCFEWLDGIVIGLTFQNNFPAEDINAHVYHYRPLQRNPALRWTKLTTAPAARARGSTGAFKRQGRLYFTNGNTGGHRQGPTTSKRWFDCYHPRSRTWTVLPSLNDRRDHGGAVYSPYDDAAYVLGGRDSGPTDFAAVENGRTSIERYSFADGGAGRGWVVLPASLASAHPGTGPVRAMRMIIVGDGELDGRTDDVTSGVEVYHVKRGSFILRGQLPKFLHRHGTAYAYCSNNIYTAAGAQRPASGGNQETVSTQVMYLDGVERTCVPQRGFWT